MKIITIANGMLIGATSNPKKSLAELKAIKEVDGCVCYSVTDAQFKKVEAGYDVSVDASGKKTFTKGKRAIEMEQEALARANDKIYKAIGEKETLRLGKESAGADASEEIAMIADLKAKLK